MPILLSHKTSLVGADGKTWKVLGNFPFSVNSSSSLFALVTSDIWLRALVSHLSISCQDWCARYYKMRFHHSKTSVNQILSYDAPDITWWDKFDLKSLDANQATVWPSQLSLVLVTWHPWQKFINEAMLCLLRKFPDQLAVGSPVAWTISAELLRRSHKLDPYSFPPITST